MRIRLIHWKEEEAEDRASRLRNSGSYDVDSRPLGKSPMKSLRASLPDVFVIDLSRLPSHGREIALALRQSKSTRRILIIFVDGEVAKVERIRSVLPDAIYCTWRGINGALKRAQTMPPTDPVVPDSIKAGYSGTPLPKKLGIKPDSSLALINAPDGFRADALQDLPNGVSVRTHMRGPVDLIFFFTKSRSELKRRIDAIHRNVRNSEGAVWIIWPKKTSGVQTDLTQNDVRTIGLASGLVDYKICAVDDTWSGLKFTTRKK